jgi:aspartyl-tRNA(Asn)/glutamyl-tRNA(Gln) amidotransferase subunit B
VIEFLKELQRIIRFNHIGDCDLEKGHMRVDVNISVKKPEEQKFRTRVELKNINSFGAIKRAIEYEYHRQCDIYNQ